jgi:hypothetical protein
MSDWTLVARPEGGSVAVDLTIDGGSPLTLGSVEAGELETALGKALEGIEHPAEFHA